MSRLGIDRLPPIINSLLTRFFSNHRFLNSPQTTARSCKLQLNAQQAHGAALRTSTGGSPVSTGDASYGSLPPAPAHCPADPLEKENTDHRRHHQPLPPDSHLAQLAQLSQQPHPSMPLAPVCAQPNDLHRLGRPTPPPADLSAVFPPHHQLHRLDAPIEPPQLADRSTELAGRLHTPPDAQLSICCGSSGGCSPSCSPGSPPPRSDTSRSAAATSTAGRRPPSATQSPPSFPAMSSPPSAYHSHLYAPLYSDGQLLASGLFHQSAAAGGGGAGDSAFAGLLHGAPMDALTAAILQQQAALAYHPHAVGGQPVGGGQPTPGGMSLSLLGEQQLLMERMRRAAAAQMAANHAAQMVVAAVGSHRRRKARTVFSDGQLHGLEKR